jgi:hypothetical protein
MTVSLSLLAGSGWQFFDNSGDVLTGGQLYSYAAGTTTPATTYTSVTGATANSNPIVLDAAGRVPYQIWLTDGFAYKFQLTDSTGTQIGVWDNITSQNTGSTGLNASAISYTAASSTTERTVQAKLQESVSVKDFGAVGNGVVDDTSAVQAALSAVSSSGFRLLFPAGTYLCGPLFVYSNTSITFDPSAVLYARAGFGLNDRFLNITSVSNVTIHGNMARLRMPKAEYTSGEQRHGVFITSATNVLITNFRSTDTGGDGFYIGEATPGVPSKNINILECQADNNRRQGMSIVSVVNCLVQGGLYSNTIGTAPQAGIDVEPNAGCVIQSVTIRDVRTYNNAGCGIIVVPTGSGSVSNSTFSLVIDSCYSEADGSANGDASFKFDNGAAPANAIQGQILVRNCTSLLANRNGLLIGYLTWGSNCPQLDIDTLRIISPAQTATASTAFAAGVNMYTNFAATNLSNVTLRKVTCDDYTAKMYCGFYMSSAATYGVVNVNMYDCSASTQLLADSQYVILTKFQGSILNSNPPVKTFAAGNFALQRYTGYLITQSGNGVLTLPDATLHAGLEYTFQNTANTTMQVRPAGADSILYYGLAAGNDMVSVTTGDYMKLRSLGATGWIVLALNGAWRPLGYSKPNRILWNDAAPTTGTWERGDRVFRVSAAIGSPKSWVCTVAGTPGTWVSEGNL